MAAGVVQIKWIEGISNIAGAFTKRLSAEGDQNYIKIELIEIASQVKGTK